MTSQPTAATGAPARAGLALTALAIAALTCNINLAVANVALPDIGRDFAASQSALNLIAVGCTLGLAMSVLYFGALGDRYGRKKMLVIGLAGTVLASLFSAFSPTAELLAASRLLTGLFAGMAYPTTLALITALWAPGIRRTKAIALWSGISSGAAALGPVVAGLLLGVFWWGSVFLIALPLAVIGLILVIVAIPSGVNESKERVDHLGGVLSVVMIGALVVALSFIGGTDTRTAGLISLGVAVVAGVFFFWRQRVAANPLYDLTVARRRLFWVPAVGGMIVFGSLMGSMFVGQQFVQNVLGIDTAMAGLTALPSAVALVISAQISAMLLIRRGSRITMVAGYAFVFLAFVSMFFWNESTGFWAVLPTYALMGFGAGLALTPASRSLTGSTPVHRVGMASGTADLQRDLGGSVMQAVFGSILAAGFSASFARQIAKSPDASQISATVEAQLRASFGSATEVAKQFPQYADQIISAARESFLHGSLAVFVIGAVAVVVGGLVVLFGMPNKQKEHDLTEQYAKADADK